MAGPTGDRGGRNGRLRSRFGPASRCCGSPRARRGPVERGCAGRTRHMRGCRSGRHPDAGPHGRSLAARRRGPRGRRDAPDSRGHRRPLLLRGPVGQGRDPEDGRGRTPRVFRRKRLVRRRDHAGRGRRRGGRPRPPRLHRQPRGQTRHTVHGPLLRGEVGARRLCRRGAAGDGSTRSPCAARLTRTDPPRRRRPAGRRRG